MGAWLGLWTPGRDVEVPAFPRAKGAAIGLALLLIVAAGYSLLAPGITEDKRIREQREQRAAEEQRAELLARLRRDVRPVHGRARSARPAPADAPAAEQLAARRALLAELAAAVEADASARAARGELHGPIRRAECVPYPLGTDPPERDLARPSGRYACTAVTSDIERTERNVGGIVGHPFVASVDFTRFTWAFCKVAPPPGERAANRTHVEVPRECAG